MLINNLRALYKDKLLFFGVCCLLLGQLLYFAGFGGLFVLSLVFVLAVGLPYPPLLRSWIGRSVVALLLALSFLQLAALVQFFLVPDTDFKVLSLITTLLVVALVFALCGHRPGGTVAIADRRDLGALLTAAFFVVPFALYCFWGNNPAQLLTFGGVQSPDGMAHNAGLGEMHGAQHLTYRTNSTYYPKGFHIAQAVIMDGLYLHQRDLNWVGNARVFVVQYLVWGFLLAYTLYYLAVWLLETGRAKLRQSQYAALAVLLGPVLSLLYLLPFAQEGFLNFYYICASCIASWLFLEGFGLRSQRDIWFVGAYFLLALGVTMSWGPLILPVLGLAPVIYMLRDISRPGDLLRFWNVRYWPVVAGALLLVAPLYIHFAFSDETAFNAHGSIRIFHAMLLLAGVGAVAFIIFGKNVAEDWKDFTVSVLVPGFVLIGGLVSAQYLTAGEPRYYSIKTAYLFEMMLIVVFAVLLLHAIKSSKFKTLQFWIAMPVVFGVGIFLLVSANGNPFASLKSMLGRPAFYESDVQKMAKLAQEGELKGHNNAVLHYNPGERKIYGQGLISNWANSMSPVNDGNQASSECNGTIFTTLTYGLGVPAEQPKLIEAIKACIELRTKQNKPYYIITDPDSVPYLKRLLGDKAVFL